MTIRHYLESRYTAATTESYLREIAAFTGNYPAADKATFTDVTAYIRQLRLRYTNPQTLNRIVSAIKVYYDYLCYSGERQDHPAKSIRLHDQRSRDVQLQELFTAQELEGLLGKTERYKALYNRNKVLMGLLVYQGLRVQEIAQIHVTDVDLDNGNIYIKSTPNTNSRTLTLKAPQIMVLHTYLKEDRPQLLQGKESATLLIGKGSQPMPAEDISKYVIRSFRNYYPGRVVTTQTIRQSVIANLLTQGHDISVVQQFAGHKYPSSTERYKQSEVEVLRAAIDQYHPMK